MQSKKTSPAWWFSVLRGRRGGGREHGRGGGEKTQGWLSDLIIEPWVILMLDDLMSYKAERVSCAWELLTSLPTVMVCNDVRGLQPVTVQQPRADTLHFTMITGHVTSPGHMLYSVSIEASCRSAIRLSKAKCYAERSVPFVLISCRKSNIVNNNTFVQ